MPEAVRLASNDFFLYSDSCTDLSNDCAVPFSLKHRAHPERFRSRPSVQEPPMISISYRRVLSTASFVFTPLFVAPAQQTYRSPPADLIRILEAPANPVSSISPNRQWILITVSDPRTITISDMADSAYYLAGSKIRANPDYRIENIGIRSGKVSSIDGKTERALQVPSAGRIGTTSWSSDGEHLAYTTIGGGKMELVILDPATGVLHHIAAAGLSGKMQDLDWSRDGRHLAFTATTPAGTAVWIADVASGTARRLTGPALNFTTARGNIVDDPGCGWLNGKAPLVCRLWPAQRHSPSGAPSSRVA